MKRAVSITTDLLMAAAFIASLAALAASHAALTAAHAALTAAQAVEAVGLLHRGL